MKNIVLRGSHDNRISANFKLYSWLLNDYIVNNTMGLKASELHKTTMSRKQQNYREIDQIIARNSPLSFLLSPSRDPSHARSQFPVLLARLKSKRLRRRQRQIRNEHIKAKKSTPTHKVCGFQMSVEIARSLELTCLSVQIIFGPFKKGAQ